MEGLINISFSWFIFNDLFGIFFWSFLECSLVPLPAELVVIPFVALTGAEPITVAVTGCLGSILGAIFDYIIGLKAIDAFEKLVKRDVRGYARKQLRRYKRFGKSALAVVMALGRILPLSLKPLLFLAGSIRMNLAIYLILIGVCSFIRYYVAATVGYLLPYLLERWALG